VTLPKSDAQFARLLPRRQHLISPPHSTSATPSLPPDSSSPPSQTPPALAESITPAPEISEPMGYEHAIDFATHSWDLATGGLKTLTAKRELPPRLERRARQTPLDTAPARSYTLVLAIVACILLMLIGGGVVLFVMLQP
jgi:hypothetical protein